MRVCGKVEKNLLPHSWFISSPLNQMRIQIVGGKTISPALCLNNYWEVLAPSIKKITLTERALLNNYWDTKQEKIVFPPTIWIFIWFKGDEMNQPRGSKKNSTSITSKFRLVTWTLWLVETEVRKFMDFVSLINLLGCWVFRVWVPPTWPISHSVSSILLDLSELVWPCWDNPSIESSGWNRNKGS